jgi:hypothetical protein
LPPREWIRCGQGGLAVECIARYFQRHPASVTPI